MCFLPLETALDPAAAVTRRRTLDEFQGRSRGNALEEAKTQPIDDDDGARERPSRPRRRSSRRRSQRSRPLLRALLVSRGAARVRRRHPGRAHAGRPRSRRAQPLRGPPLPGAVARLLGPDDPLERARRRARRSARRAAPARLSRRAVGRDRVARAASYWEKGRVVAYLRAFEHPSRAEPARRIELRLAGHEIESIRDLDAGRELAGRAARARAGRLVLRTRTASSASRCGSARSRASDRRGARGRGPALRGAPRHRPAARRSARRWANLHRGRGPPGRQHADPAARQELLPDARAQLRSQAQGSRDGAARRGALREAGDPRGVSQRDLPRAARADVDPRRRRGVALLLREARALAAARRRGAARRTDPQPGRLLAVRASRRRASRAATSCCS